MIARGKQQRDLSSKRYLDIRLTLSSSESATSNGGGQEGDRFTAPATTEKQNPHRTFNNCMMTSFISSKKGAVSLGKEIRYSKYSSGLSIRKRNQPKRLLQPVGQLPVYP